MNIASDPSAIFYSMKGCENVGSAPLCPAIAAAPTPRTVNNIAIAGISGCPSQKNE